MQDRPDRLALLGAIARFLEHDVRPALKDPGLSFRALIAAHLAGTVAAELKAEGDLTAPELGRLRALLPDIGAPGRDKRALRPEPHPDAAGAGEGRDERLRLRAELARRIRERLLDDEQRRRAFDHVMQTLREDLQVYQPRFDTSPDAD